METMEDKMAFATIKAELNRDITLHDTLVLMQEIGEIGGSVSTDWTVKVRVSAFARFDYMFDELPASLNFDLDPDSGEVRSFTFRVEKVGQEAEDLIRAVVEEIRDIELPWKSIKYIPDDTDYVSGVYGEPKSEWVLK